MAQASLRPPSTLQPRPKAVPTFSSNTVGAVSESSTPQLSRPASRSRNPSPARPAIHTDVSDRATTALVRRVLCPNAHGVSEKERPIYELLPPLTSSNEVDLQLYAIIAVVVKDLVYSWYGKITPDQTFVEEVVKIIAHCTRALESRLRGVDVHALILDEIPELVERHIHGKHLVKSLFTPSLMQTAYRTSRDASLIPGQSTDARFIYHGLNPHPALSPIPDPNVPTTIEQQAKNESEYRQLLVQGALAVLLPTEDLENACLRTLLTDVISDVILAKSIGGTLCEGWFVWGSVFQLVELAQATMKPRANDQETKTKTRGRLEKFGLLSGKEEETAGGSEQSRSRLSSVFWRILQYCYLASIGIRFIVVELFAAHSQPRRSSRVGRPSTSASPSASPSPMASDFAPDGFLRPLLDFRMLPLAATMIDLPRRLPWISGLVALIHHHLTRGALGAIGGTDGILDQ